MLLSIERRVARGARLLDQVRPGWAGAVDMEVFDIEDLERCILGQVYGDWLRGCQSLGTAGNRYKQELNGFEMTEDEYCSSNINSIRNRYATLWGREVLERTTS